MIGNWVKLLYPFALSILVGIAVKYGYDTGYETAEHKHAQAALEAVEAAREEWDKQHTKDEAIVQYVTEKQIEYRDREKIVYRDLIRWKEPAGCRDLGAEFRRLFNGETSGGAADSSAGERAETTLLPVDIFTGAWSGRTGGQSKDGRDGEFRQPGELSGMPGSG